MNPLEEVIDAIIAVEGEEFTDDPHDLGGATKYGITQATLSAHRGFQVSKSEVRSLTEAEAREIYRDMYITGPGFDRVYEVSGAVGLEVIDTGVNLGVVYAARFLQQSLNALNNAQKLYPDLLVDGRVGTRTIAALNCYLSHRNVSVLLKAQNCLQGARYIELCFKREANETFVYGWLQQRVQLPRL